MTRTFDYIVVGGGTAGCVVAAGLARKEGTSVAMFEAGGADRSPLIAVPGANAVTGAAECLNWSYQTAPVAGLNGRSLYWAQGRVIGGSGTINGMMYLRGIPSDYDHWRDQGAKGWGWEDVLPVYRRIENHMGGESALHGGAGPLRIASGNATAPVCDMFIKAGEAAGLRRVDGLNDGTVDVIGYADQTIGKGRRSSTARAFLRPELHRKNLHVVTRANVERIVIKDGRAVGILWRDRHGHHEAIARREVILCGGAVNTPQLLMLSGIGPAEELQRHGISVISSLPGVGQNLQNHPTFKLMYGLTAPLSAYAHLRPIAMLKAGANYFLHRKGVLASGLFPVAAQFRPPEGEAVMQVLMAPALIIRRKPGVLGILPQSHGFSLLISQALPHSRGHIALASADPAARAEIHPGYFSDPRDMRELVAATSHVRHIVRQGPLGTILGPEIGMEGLLDSPKGIAAAIRANATTSFHASGTCRMGTDPMAVVDAQLRVKGLAGLRVADASVIPRMITGSTYAPVIMIAQRAVDFIVNTIN